MTDMIEIEVVLDESCVDPKVKIFTKSKTEQVEDIIHAIENRTRSIFSPIPVNENGKYMVISQRDIYRIRTQGREVLLDTKDHSYTIRGTIAKFENDLDKERFFRISQSEIINLYKVDTFDFNVTGTIGVLFDNGVRSWVARRCVKPLRDLLKTRYGNV